jgi:Protein of unknown function (DUF3800)
MNLVRPFGSAGSWLGVLDTGEHLNVVRVVYSDETGLGSEREEPHTVITALMLNIDVQWHPVFATIEKSIRRFVGRGNISNFELKGRLLYRKIRKGDRKAARLMRDLMEIPGQFLIPVFHSAVNRAGFSRFMKEVYIPTVRGGRGIEDPIGASDTFSQALLGCMSLVDSYVHTTLRDEQILWIHDQGGYGDEAKDELDQIRSLANFEVWRHISRQMLGNPVPRRSHIIDTIYFCDSKASRALQLADVCCSTIARHLRGEPGAEEFYKILRPQIVNADARPEHENIEEAIAGMQELLKKRKKSK